MSFIVNPIDKDDEASILQNFSKLSSQNEVQQNVNEQNQKRPGDMKFDEDLKISERHDKKSWTREQKDIYRREKAKILSQFKDTEIVEFQKMINDRARWEELSKVEGPKLKDLESHIRLSELLRRNYSRQEEVNKLQKKRFNKSQMKFGKCFMDGFFMEKARRCFVKNQINRYLDGESSDAQTRLQKCQNYGTLSFQYCWEREIRNAQDNLNRRINFELARIGLPTVNDAITNTISDLIEKHKGGISTPKGNLHQDDANYPSTLQQQDQQKSQEEDEL